MENTAKKTTLRCYRLDLFNKYGMGEPIIFSTKKKECLNERRFRRSLPYDIEGMPIEHLTTFDIDKKDFQLFKTYEGENILLWLYLWERGEIIRTQYFY
jgi:hypothetical protein